ncbi:MAG TPA: Ig-like domain-containing protein [Myxococcales bacterium]
MKKLSARAALVAALVVGSACQQNAVPPPSQAAKIERSSRALDASALGVYVGYADNLRASPAFPVPWQGSPNVLFIGSSSPFDAGAIRLDNPTASPVAVDSVVVDLQRPGPTFNLWGSFTIPPQSSAILTQTTQFNFDTSDFEIVGCGGTVSAGDPRVPRVTVTAGGVSSAFLDTGHVLDTGGFDLACIGNESLQWRLIGTAGIGSTTGAITLQPATATVAVGSPFSATALVTDAGGLPLANAVVDFAVVSGPDTGRIGQGTTDASGSAVFTFTSATVGIDAVVATLANGSGGTLSSNQSIVTWVSGDPCPRPAAGPDATRLLYVGAAAGEVNDPFRLAALLTDSTGMPLAGRTVSFSLAAQGASAVTDANGVASTSLVPSAVGSATLSLSYAGEQGNQPASASVPVAIDRDETSIAYTGPQLVAAGQPQPVSAVLTDSEEGTPLAGKTITFSAGSATASAVTGADGSAHATLALTAADAVGAGTLTVAFAGDDTEKPSSTAAPVTTYLATSFVVWGGNAGGIALGQRVNFWGAQWAKQVLQGDYDAHAEFKGWAIPAGALAPCEPAAHTGAAPLLDQSCWTSKSGDSFPPPSLAPYIGVIVSTAIAKSQATIYGNVAGLLVVKVDPSPAYGNVPGQPGFGTVVATIADATGALPPAPALAASQKQPQAALPGAGFDVTLSAQDMSSTPALSAVASEQFSSASPASGSFSFGTIAGGSGAATVFHETAASVAGRQAGETGDAYLARLAAADGSSLSSNALITYVGPTGLSGAPAAARSSGRLSLPILSVALTATRVVEPGGTIAYTVRAADIGSAGATSGTVMLTLPDGSTRSIDLGAIAAGASASATVEFAVASPAPRGPSESVADYLSRLQALDRARLAATASLSWTDAAGNSYGAVEASASTEQGLPILTISAAQPAATLPGQVVPLAFSVQNVGSCSAGLGTISILDSDGSAGTGAAFSLLTAQSITVQASGRAPAVAPKAAGETDAHYLARLHALENAPVPFGWSLDWSDAAGASFGPETGIVTSPEQLPIVTVALSGPASAISGQSIAFTASLANTGLTPASVSVSATMPDGSTRSASVASIAPGGSAAVQFPFTVPAAQPTGSLSASATETWADTAGGAYGPLSSNTAVPVRHPPIVSAGPAQTVTLPAGAALSGSVSEPGLPAAFAFSTGWSVVSGPGPVTFDDATQPVTTAHFSVPGSYVLQLLASDGVLSAAATVQITVLAAPKPGTLALAPAQAGPDPVGATQSLQATLLDFQGRPVAGQSITFTVTGANPRTGSGTTDAAGHAAFSYSGAAAGTDNIQATAASGERSGTSTISWVVPTQVVSTSTVESLFFTADGSGIFNTPRTATPVFAQTFPTINFNPPAGTVPGNTSGVGVNTRPFVDVTTDLNGNFTGTITAQGNGAQAGVGSLFVFNAVFRGTLVVSQAGDRTFSFFSDDGFVFGVGNGATPLPGNPNLHPPAGGLTPFDGLPVMGSFNTPTAPVGNAVAVHFPAPGVYPYELDYSECCGGQLALTMTSGGHGLPPAGSLALSPGAATSGLVGVPQTFTVTARDAAGAAAAGATVTLSVLGANAREVLEVTNASGVATFTYAAANSGVDTLQASAVVGGMGAISNITSVNWSPNPNHAPVVSAGPGQTVSLAGGTATVALTGTVTDDGLPAGSHLTSAWTQVSGPAAVTFSAPAAAVTNATFTAAGDYVLRLTASDSQLSSSAQVTVTVQPEAGPPNQPPVVSAGPAQVATLSAASVTLTLRGSVTDDGLPAGGTLQQSWSAVSGPAPVSFGTPSAPVTTATFTAAGDYLLRLSASDSALSSSSDVPVTITAGAVNQPPVVSAGAAQTITLPANTVTLSGSVADDGLPAGGVVVEHWTLSSGPAQVVFGAPRAPVTTATFGAPGLYTLRLTASDSQLVRFAETTVTVQPPASAGGTPPTVAPLGGPPDGAQVSTPTPIVGSVSDGFWTLAYALDPASPSATWTTFASGTGPQSNATLGTFDPTLLVNGAYGIRLTAYNAAGTSESSIGVYVRSQLKVGVFTLSYTDLSVPVAGLPIQVMRTYDSRDKRVGDFGVGWRVSVADARVDKTAVLGDPWQEISTGGFFPSFCLQSTKAPLVTITLSEDKVYSFLAQPTQACQTLFPFEFADMGFISVGPIAGASLVALDTDNTVLVNGGAGGPVQLLNDDTLEEWNPQRFQLTTETGEILVVSVGGGAESKTDRNGNTLSIGPGGIVSSTGKSVTFTRDGQGRITTITDPMGQTRQYAYDLAGDLVGATDRNGNTSTYGYDDGHDLVSILDPRGLAPSRDDYDASGRLVSHTDPNGHTIQYAHDLAARHEQITDRDGNTSIYEYDERGNITRITDPLGGVQTRTYDANDNKLSETDPLGHTRSYTYDANNNRTSETDPLGNVTRYTYNAQRQVLTITDPLGHLTTNAYDAHGNLTSTTDPTGAVTSHQYDLRGLETAMTDPLGNVTRYEYDGFGNLTKATDPLGNATTWTYDANGNRLTESRTRTGPSGIETLTTSYVYDAQGHLVRTARPDGSVVQTQYDELGKKSATIDALGRATSYAYDDGGRLVRTTYPDGTSESIAYDPNGRRISAADRQGRTTSFAYDALGRLTTTTYADGSTTSMGYDANGVQVSATDALGRITRYENDAASRRTREIDPLGNATTLAYDADNNLVSRTDPLGHTTTFAYDAANRQVGTTFADGTSTTRTLDGNGRVLSTSDQAANVTRYSYDAAGRLMAVTDALGGVVQFGYDEVGNRIAQTDANGHTTTSAWDAMGRRTRRTFPRGGSEAWTWDAAGNMSTHTDAAGKVTSFAWDSDGRMLSRTPDPSFGEAAIRYSWSPTGRRLAMTDASGTTQYTYDLRDRMVAKATPHGTITHAFDAAGDLLSVRTSNAGGAAVDYTWDGNGRLATVSDANGAGTAGYAWDGAGNLTGWSAANGVQTNLAYDALNRLTSMASSAGTTALTSYTYVLGPAGNRTHAAELGGRAVDYQYDALYRLTRETVAGDAIAGTVAYTYDAGGNRLSRSSTLPGVASGTASFDADDRPAADTVDANGNTIASAGKAWSYDFDDRLVSQNGGAVSVVYDGDGNRAAKTASGVTTFYLVDEVNPTGYPQVLEEISGGVVRSANTWGHALLVQRRRAGASAASSFYLYDGQGNVRALTDAAGNVTDRYDYDAFGVPLRVTGTTPNDYRYGGEQVDPDLGLTYLRARYLNNDSGRFLTRDRIDPQPRDPRSVHRYVYADGDPVDMRDPSGLLPDWLAGILVHQAIGYHYTLPDPAGLCRLANRAISTIVRDPGTSLLRPDLTDRCNFEAYEIKPAGSFAAGEAQLDGYITLLIAMTGMPWHPGVLYDPPAALPISAGDYAIIDPPRAGVILYKLLDFDQIRQEIQAAEEAEMAEVEDEIALDAEVEVMGGF